MGRRMGLMAWDFALSFMWVWAGSLAKLFAYSFLGWGHTPEAEAIKLSISVLYMYFFAWMVNLSRGAAYNPLTLLSSAFMGGLDGFLFTAFCRIPAQIAGSIIGVRLIKETFPQVGHGPRLNVDIHHGAMIEGLLTFMIVIVSLGLKKKDPRSFFMKTWISTISKMSLHILGSDLTGGIMNPASVMDAERFARLLSGKVIFMLLCAKDSASCNTHLRYTLSSLPEEEVVEDSRKSEFCPTDVRELS